jgi:hypothetical protein
MNLFNAEDRYKQIEGLSVELKRWNDVEFVVRTPRHNLHMLIAVNADGDNEYKNSVSPITDLNIKAVSLLEGLKLPQFNTKKPVFSCAIIPSGRFLRTANIPENYKWATICSRGIWQDDREDAVVVSAVHASTIDFDIQAPLSILAERQVDVIREAVHEHLPTLRDTYLPYPSASALPISEAMDEAVPRFILEMQRKMPKSTQFLTDLKDEDILTVEDLWNGFSKYSSSPVSSNRAYGSAFLFGVGLLEKLQGKYGVDKTGALTMWLNSMIEAHDGLDVVTKLSDRVGLGKDALWSSIAVQKEGQELISSVS